MVLQPQVVVVKSRTSEALTQIPQSTQIIESQTQRENEGTKLELCRFCCVSSLISVEYGRSGLKGHGFFD